MSYTTDRSFKTRGVGAIAATDLKQSQAGAVVRTGAGAVRVIPSKESRGSRWPENDMGPAYSMMGATESHDYRAGADPCPLKNYGRTGKDINRAIAERNECLRQRALAAVKAVSAAQDAEKAKKAAAAKAAAYKAALAKARAERKRLGIGPGGRPLIVSTAGGSSVILPPAVPGQPAVESPIVPPSSPGVSSGGGAPSSGGGGGGGFSYGGGGGAPSSSASELDQLDPAPAETSPAQDVQAAAALVAQAPEAAAALAKKPMANSTKLLIGLGVGYVLYTLGSKKKGKAL